MSAGDDPDHTAFVDEEMRAAVDETHRLGRWIAMHAIGTDTISRPAGQRGHGQPGAQGHEIVGQQLLGAHGAGQRPVRYVLDRQLLGEAKVRVPGQDGAQLFAAPREGRSDEHADPILEVIRAPSTDLAGLSAHRLWPAIGADGFAASAARSSPAGPRRAHPRPRAPGSATRSTSAAGRTSWPRSWKHLGAGCPRRPEPRSMRRQLLE